MEADWSVELAAYDPLIIVPWAAPDDDPRKCKFVDLRLGAQLVDEIKEARLLPALRSALLLLNSDVSPFWTVKCDAWNSNEPLDPFEMDAEPEDAAFGAGSYIDLLFRDRAAQSGFERHQRWLRVVAQTLRIIPAKSARVELVLRRADVNGLSCFGVTWFVEGCGATSGRAQEAWASGLGLALPVIMNVNDTMAESGE